MYSCMLWNTSIILLLLSKNPALKASCHFPLSTKCSSANPKWEKLSYRWVKLRYFSASGQFAIEILLLDLVFLADSCVCA